MDDFRVMVFELLGPKLEDLFRYCGIQFSLKTAFMIVDQRLDRFDSLHSTQYIHRNIKPENFLMGLGGRGNCIYMTDVALAIYHTPDQAVLGVAHSCNPQLIDTARYASINGHLGKGGEHSILKRQISTC